MNSTQRGFTMIELMITLLLSSLLLAAIGKLFIDSGKSYKKQKTLSYLVEDGRYAQDVLAKEIRHIGFLTNREESGKQPKDVFTKDSNVLGSGLTLEDEEIVVADYKSTGFGGDDFDINHLVFRYQVTNTDAAFDNNSFDASPCTIGLGPDEGDPTADNIVITTYLYVAFNQDLASPILYCKSKLENLSCDEPALTPAEKQSCQEKKNKPKPPNAPKSVPLISNVERMHVLYGIDTDDDLFANQYLVADQVASWGDVVSIRLYLIFGSEDTNMSYKTPKYTLDGKKYSVQSPNDKRLYKVFATTIALRNVDVL